MTRGVVIAADAGPVAGLGHLQRCFALAAALREIGIVAFFVVPASDAATVQRVDDAGFDRVDLAAVPWSVDAAEEIRRAAADRRAGLIVVDSEAAGLSFLQGLGDGPVPVAAVDDNASRSLVAAAVLNGNAHAATLSYSGMAQERCLLGPRYMMLPAPYWAHEPTLIRAPARRALVTLGGGDPHDLWPRLLDHLTELADGLVISAVIGPFVARTPRLEKAILRFREAGSVAVAPASLAPLIGDVDVALTAAGQTLYELAALGRPAVALELAANQAPQLAAFVAAGAVIPAGNVSAPRLLDTAVAQLAALAGDPTRLRRMAEAGPKLVDGQGARRVAAALASWFWPA